MQSVLIVTSMSLSSGTSSRCELDATVKSPIDCLSGRWRLHVPGAQIHSFAEGCWQNRCFSWNSASVDLSVCKWCLTLLSAIADVSERSHLIRLLLLFIYRQLS